MKKTLSKICSLLVLASMMLTTVACNKSPEKKLKAVSNDKKLSTIVEFTEKAQEPYNGPSNLSLLIKNDGELNVYASKESNMNATFNLNGKLLASETATESTETPKTATINGASLIINLEYDKKEGTYEKNDALDIAAYIKDDYIYRNIKTGTTERKEKEVFSLENFLPKLPETPNTPPNEDTVPKNPQIDSETISAVKEFIESPYVTVYSFSDRKGSGYSIAINLTEEDLTEEFINKINTSSPDVAKLLKQVITLNFDVSFSAFFDSSNNLETIKSKINIDLTMKPLDEDVTYTSTTEETKNTVTISLKNDLTLDNSKSLKIKYPKDLDTYPELEEEVIN